MVLDGVPQAAFMISPDGQIRAWNHDMEEMTGISVDDALERTDIGMLLYESTEVTMFEQVLDAPEATDEVTEIGQEVVESVTTLGEQMDDIENVVEIISEVAE